MQQNNQDNLYPAYKNLSEIRLRKAQLLAEITKDSNKIRVTWNQLFHRSPMKAKTPAKRMSRFVNTGAGIVDGIILGWKLYRKFKK